MKNYIGKWEEVLKSRKSYGTIAREIEWGFYPEDLHELAALHKAGKYKSKIEFLLIECNYHSLCRAWIKGDYKEAEE